jgi:hypothetical protein
MSMGKNSAKKFAGNFVHKNRAELNTDWIDTHLTEDKSEIEQNQRGTAERKERRK